MIAVIKTGGKQYKVSEGDVIVVERLEANEGDTIKLDEVLFVGDEEEISVGTPVVSGATVEATVKSQGRNKKVWGIKHKAKKRFMLKFGHKQLNTELEIVKIAK